MYIIYNENLKKFQIKRKYLFLNPPNESIAYIKI